MPTTTPGIACMHQWRRVDGAEVMIYALGLAMSGKNPTMPPKNSSELASDSVLSKRSASTAVLGCRSGGVVRGGWKAWPSASTLHRRPSRRSDCGIVSLHVESCPLLTNQMRESLRRQELAALVTNWMPSPEVSLCNLKISLR